MSGIVKGIFGGTSSAEKILRRFQPAGFSGGGLTGRFDRGRNAFSVTRTPERDKAIAGVTSGFLGKAGEIRELRGEVRPGFGRLSRIRKEGLRTRLAGIRDTGRRVVGNIREELARRRLGGSSFQTSATAVAEAEFGKLSDVARAEAQEQEAGAFLQELDLTRQLIGEEFGASISAAQVVLEELNIESSLAASSGALASQLMQQNLSLQAEARAASEAGAAEFVASILGATIPTKIKVTTT